MLLQQLASFFLCSQFSSPSEVQQTLGLHCSTEGCREFLKCHAPSSSTCSCFLYKEMKAFSCPKKHLVVSESGISDLPDATRFYCQHVYPTLHVPLPSPAEYLTGIIIIGKLLDSERNFICLQQKYSIAYTMTIYLSQEGKVTINKGTRFSVIPITFPVKADTKFEMELLFREEGYEVQVDGEEIDSGHGKTNCNIKQVERLILRSIEADSLHFKYNE